MLGFKRKIESLQSFNTVSAQANKRRLVVIVVLIVALLVGILLAVRFLKNNQQTALERAACSEAILHEASSAIDQTKVPQLKTIVDKIQGISGYDKDPDCLYVVVMYHANNYDIDNARKSLDSLKKVYDSKEGVSNKLGAYVKVKSLEELEAYIAFMDERKVEIKNSILTVPNQ